MTYNRYRNNLILKDTSGTRYFGTSVSATYTPDSTDTYIRTQEGDRLDTIAYRFYGDVSLWAIIASANSIGHGTLQLESGLQLVIPNKGKIKV